MTYLKPAIYLLLLTTIATGCKKENSIKSKSTEALIMDTGLIAADGCGWLIKVDSNIYHPDSLPSGFQKNNLNVVIDYNLLSTKFQCGLDPNNKLAVIHLNSIKNK
jgi:hypothetical protein